jgi:uncharacterized protein YndB with AHSA1/START domain
VHVGSDRRFTFDTDRAVVWDALTRTGEYRSWWPWLRHFEAGGLVAGQRWTCVARPPLPYSVRFTVLLDEVTAPERVAATIGGDLDGRAELTIEERAAGCELRLSSQLVAARGLLRTMAVVAGPAARFGHDWLISTGARQFAAHL